MANFCSNCGVSLSDDMKFCTKCGNKIRQENSDENNSDDATKEEKTSGSTHKSTGNPATTFVTGDESLDELLIKVTSQKNITDKSGVVMLIAMTQRFKRPHIYDQLIQKLREVEPELIESLAEEDEDGEMGFRKKEIPEKSQSATKTSSGTGNKQLLTIISYSIAGIAATIYATTIANGVGIMFILGVLTIPALISYGIHRSKYNKFNNCP